MASLNVVTITFTTKEITVTKKKAVVYAANELEALVLLKKKTPNFWALLETHSVSDKGWLIQGKNYNRKSRVHSIKVI